MPIKTCSIGQLDGFKWGDQGNCYTFRVGDTVSRERAKELAWAEGVAIGMQEHIEKQSHSEEYLKTILEKAKELMTKEQYEKLFRFARSSAGGKIKGKNYRERKEKEQVQKDNSHIHELPDGSFSGPAIKKEGGHVHLYGGGKKTSLGKGDDLIHYHELEDGSPTGHPVLAIAKDEKVQKALEMYQPVTVATPERQPSTDIEEAKGWASTKYPVAVTPILNGEAVMIHRSATDNKVQMYFNDDPETDVGKRFPSIYLGMKTIPFDFIVEADLTIRKDGQRVFLTDLKRLRNKNIKLGGNERLELTLSDILYRDEDISELPYTERRDVLEGMYKENVENSIPNIRLSNVEYADGEDQLDRAISQITKEKQSMGAYLIDTGSAYISGFSDDLFALLREKFQTQRLTKAADMAAKAYEYAASILKGDDPKIDRVNKTQEDKANTVSCPIFKADEDRRLIYGIVLEPDTVDAHGDKISRNEIEKAAHFFLKKSRVIGLGHTEIANASPVESYLSPVDFTTDGPFGEQVVKAGTWVLGVHVPDDEQWQMVKNGDFQAFSVGGFGLREEQE